VYYVLQYTSFVSGYFLGIVRENALESSHFPKELAVGVEWNLSAIYLFIGLHQECHQLRDYKFYWNWNSGSIVWAHEEKDKNRKAEKEKAKKRNCKPRSCFIHTAYSYFTSWSRKRSLQTSITFLGILHCWVVCVASKTTRNWIQWKRRNGNEGENRQYFQQFHSLSFPYIPTAVLEWWWHRIKLHGLFLLRVCTYYVSEAKCRPKKDDHFCAFGRKYTFQFAMVHICQVFYKRLTYYFLKFYWSKYWA